MPSSFNPQPTTPPRHRPIGKRTAARQTEAAHCGKTVPHRRPEASSHRITENVKSNQTPYIPMKHNDAAIPAQTKSKLQMAIRRQYGNFRLNRQKGRLKTFFQTASNHLNRHCKAAAAFSAQINCRRHAKAWPHRHERRVFPRPTAYRYRKNRARRAASHAPPNHPHPPKSIRRCRLRC